MIFQHKVTGELYELMIVSLIDMNLEAKLGDEKTPAMALGGFVLHNPSCHDPIQASLSSFGEIFEFFDFVMGGSDEQTC